MRLEEESGEKEIRSGRRVHYRHQIVGKGRQSPTLQLLMLHGTCAASAQFDSLLETLPQVIAGRSISCHLYDAVSCGKSPSVKDWKEYHTDEAVMDLKAVLETHMDASLPTIMISHSYAPNIVIRYLHRHGIPENLKGLSFLSTGVLSSANPVPNGGHPIFLLPLFLLDCLQPTLSKQFLKLAYHPETDKELIQKSLKANNANNMYMAKAFHRHHQWATLEECKSVQELPVVVMHGEADLVMPKEAGQFVADAVKAKKFIEITKASHQCMEEQPLQIAQALSDFIDDINI